MLLGLVRRQVAERRQLESWNCCEAVEPVSDPSANMRRDRRGTKMNNFLESVITERLPVYLSDGRHTTMTRISSNTRPDRRCLIELKT